MKKNSIRFSLSVRSLAGVFAVVLLPYSCKDDNKPLPSCDGVEWEYEGPEGPAYWAELCVDFASCGGEQQSPVNIAGSTDDNNLTAITRNYAATQAHIVNNGHTVQFNYDNGSEITLAGEKYQLLQFHFHTHSEHTLNGKVYPMEIHMVHRNEATGKLAVVGILVEEGDENLVLQPFMDKFPGTAGGKYDGTETFNAADILPDSEAYFTYAGSLTTPPCSEIVTWIVLEQPIQASAGQIHQIELLEHENNRPLQPLYGRTIRHFRS